jgi:ParB/RepB/Spo0J family partition protein
MPTTAEFLVDLAFDNPYQPRHMATPEYLAALQPLADDIAANGLMQIPQARPHPSIDGACELLFGHRRRDAWKLLHEQHPTGEYASFPVLLVEATDREMSDRASAENGQRSELSIIEVAEDIRRRIDAFGLSQTEAAAPYPQIKSQGAISNALKLLRLPAEMQTAIARGDLPQRLARQLVAVAEAYPAETLELAKNIMAAAPNEREDILREGLVDILNDACELGTMAFPLNFLADSPINLPKAIGDLKQLRACNGCEYLFAYQGYKFCTLPQCAQAKQLFWCERKADEFNAQHHLAYANQVEDPRELFDDWDWEKMHFLELCLKNPEAIARCGLHAAPAYKPRPFWMQITRSIHIAIWGDRAAFAELYAKHQKHKAKPAATATTTTSAAAPAQAQAAKDERRAERAAMLRHEADVLWLIKTVTVKAAEMLKGQINGPLLVYAAQYFADTRDYSRAYVEEIYGLLDYWHTVENAAETSDVARREKLVLSQIFRHVFGFNASQSDPTKFEGICENIEDLLTATPKDDEPGFGLKMWKGWNEPPIHHTDYNCHVCGQFAAQRGRLTKLELEAGWKVDQRGAAAETVVMAVACPKCKLPAAQADKQTPAKKKGK